MIPFRWRVMEKEVLEPRIAMAIEEVVLDSVSGGGDPVVHFWDWESRAVTIGNFQNADDEVYLHRCRRAGIPVIRRVSGGGTMFHSPGQELVFSICAPPGIILKDITASYHQMLEPVIKALKGLGLDPSIEENNIMLGKLKISGSAQRRTAKAVLHHGTLLYDANPWEMFGYIKGEKAVSTTRGTCSNYKSVTSISKQVDINYGELYNRIKDCLLKDRDHYNSRWTDEELYKAEELVRVRYNNDDWNLKK